MKLSAQDRKDLDKYTRFLALKSAQIIVQSRLGSRCSTPCEPTALGPDWFNLHINDLPDVLQSTQRSLNEEKMSECIPLCIEISLRNPDGDKMILEYWCLNVLPEQCEPTRRIIHTVYNRMGILLKTLVSVTRNTPAYRASRRQGPTTFVIFYQTYMQEPDLESLGPSIKRLRIGQICTPIGTVQLSLAYRGELVIPSSNGKKIEMTDDHFNSNLNGKRINKNEDDIDDLTKPLRRPPFADPNNKDVAKLLDEPQLPGVTRLLDLAKYKSSVINKNAENEIEQQVEHQPVQKNENTPQKTSDTSTTSNNPTLCNENAVVNEDYWLKELKAPFGMRGPVGELMQFYKECKTSPQLQSSPTIPPTPKEIGEMLDMYEAKLPVYDALVASFYESPDDD